MSTDRARENAFNRAVEFCYDMDGDPKRNSTRYFSPPEDYVEVAFDSLLDAVVEFLVEDGKSVAAAKVQAEFGVSVVPQPEQPA